MKAILGFGIFTEYWMSRSRFGQDAIFGAVYAHKGHTQKHQHHCLHPSALDQPSTNEIDPKDGNSHKFSEMLRKET